MKVLWLVSFRPIGKSKSNDLFQSMFVDSVKSLNNDIIIKLKNLGYKKFYSDIRNLFVIFLSLTSFLRK